MEIPNTEIIKINDYILKHKSNFTKEFGLELKKLREERKMTAEDLAERAITPVSYLRQIENGEYGVSLIKFISICNALEINPSQLISDYIIGDKTNDDLIFNEFQKNKNISKNIIEYMKNKKSL